MTTYKTKGTIRNWIVLIGILLILIICMVLKFFSTSKVKAAETISNELCFAVGDNADRLHDQLNVMTETAYPISALAEKYMDLNSELWKDVVVTLCTNSYAYMVLFTDEKGVGINSNSETVNIGKQDYFEMINLESQGYYYIEDDGILNKKALLSVIPVTKADGKKGLMMLYYSADNFSSIINEMEFDGLAFFMLIKGDGTIIAKEGNEFSEFMKRDKNFFDILLEGETGEGVFANTHTRMSNEYAGTFEITLNNETRDIVYVPVGIEDWYLISGIDHNYVEKLENLTWKTSKDIIIKLVAILFIFFGLLIVVNVINRIRYVEENRNLENIAETDMLTDLNNKISTEKKIVSYMRSSGNKSAMMFVLDIDNFKKINDTMGHAFGDEVLRSLGHDIRSVFRVSDVIGRTGGDEFTIFLKNVEGEENMYREAKKLLQFFRDFKVGNYVKYSATASIGVAVYPRDGEDFEALYKSADQALYKAKKRGKNQLAFFNEEMDQIKKL